MPTFWRACIGAALIAVAACLVVVCCQWGVGLDTGAVLLVPGLFPPTGLYAASWSGQSPFLAMLLGLALPVLLVTVAVWVFVRLRGEA